MVIIETNFIYDPENKQYLKKDLEFTDNINLAFECSNIKVLKYILLWLISKKNKKKLVIKKFIGIFPNDIAGK